MKNTIKRILTGGIMFIIAVLVAIAEYYHIPAVRWLAVLIVALMIFEIMRLKIKDKKLCKLRTAFVAWLVLMGIAGYFVGTKPWIMLLLLLIIVAADIGAWFFGRLIGAQKILPKISPNKTWSGQIAGIICGHLQQYFMVYLAQTHLCHN